MNTTAKQVETKALKRLHNIEEPLKKANNTHITKTVKEEIKSTLSRDIQNKKPLLKIAKEQHYLRVNSFFKNLEKPPLTSLYSTFSSFATICFKQLEAFEEGA